MVVDVPGCESATEGALLGARDLRPFFVLGAVLRPPPPRDGVDGPGVEAWKEFIWLEGELIVVRIQVINFVTRFRVNSAIHK